MDNLYGRARVELAVCTGLWIKGRSPDDLRSVRSSCAEDCQLAVTSSKGAFYSSTWPGEIGILSACLGDRKDEELTNHNSITTRKAAKIAVLL